jgi:hypothetical protein
MLRATKRHTCVLWKHFLLLSPCLRNEQIQTQGGTIITPLTFHHSLTRPCLAEMVSLQIAKHVPANSNRNAAYSQQVEDAARRIANERWRRMVGAGPGLLFLSLA